MRRNPEPQGRYHARYQGATLQAFRLIGAVLILVCFAFSGSSDPSDAGFRSAAAAGGHDSQIFRTYCPGRAGASDITVPMTSWAQTRLHSTKDIWGRTRVRRVPNLGRLVRVAILRMNDSSACAAPPVRIASLFNQTGPRIAIGRSPPRRYAGWVARAAQMRL